ncbi:SPFH domain-containing protein [Humisphaera borealis]|uniref:SPFH domain-containing protein n=1 Tax=Humisphaera borealis TaxID=2807512 RepID=A0A7M2WZY7_9BACT|nr:SPFH domain-containing protein [Humisphaera borealis]QOV90999.1 SPFH domain-containing protein [Humisphaera borealis]
MGLWDKITGELIDIVEWLDNTRDTMVWRFPRHNNEIKNNAKLIVRESQAAAFVREGALADVFQIPGTYTLDTRNMPILSTLLGWKYGFESPFKAEVYFVSTRVFTDRKWGTKNPFMVRDPEFGPTRIRAFGTFAIQISDVAVFLRNVAGTNSTFSVEQIGDQLRDLMTARFTDACASSKIPVLDMAANQDELGAALLSRINADFEQYGVKVTQLVVENISLPPEVEKAMDKRTSMGVLGNLDNYMKFQAANSLEKAAENPGGTAAMGMGFVMANQLGGQLGGAMNPQAGAAPAQTAGGQPPPLPTSVMFHAAIDGKQAGPFDLNAIQSQIAMGKFNGKTLVWKPGMASWSPAETVAELQGLLANLPPPLPA